MQELFLPYIYLPTFYIMYVLCFTVLKSGLCKSVCVNVCMPSCHHIHHKSNHHSAVSMPFSPHRQAGQHVAACLTAHCACPHHLPWLLDVGGGEILQQGREDPSENLGRAGRETKYKKELLGWIAGCCCGNR